MISRLIFVSLLLFTTSAFAGGGASDAGNGGGIAEKNILYANEHLDQFIQLCLQSTLCRTEPGENDLLTKILRSLNQERKTPLVFKSDKEDANFFNLEGLLRVAKTGDAIGSPIYINQNLLYSSDASLVDVPLALSILIHELGHHQNVKDHAALDRLGSKLQSLALAHQEKSEFWNGHATLTTLQYNVVTRDEDKKKIAQSDALILQNNDEIYDLTKNLIDHLTCPSQKPPIGLRLYNVYSKRGTSFDKKTSIITKPFRGWFIEVCEAGTEYDHGDFETTLHFKKISPEKFQFIPETTQIKILACKTHSKSCK